MSDELVFSSGSSGTSTIETAEMARDAAALAVVAELAVRWQRHLSEVMRFDETPAVQWVGGSVGANAFSAQCGARSVASGAESSGSALISAASNYGALEDRLTALLQSGGSLLGWAVGAASAALLNPTALAVLIGGLGVAAGGIAVGSALGAVDLDNLIAALQQHPELIVNPAFVDLIATVVASVDDGIMGALGIALPLATVLGDHGLGLSGTDTAAAGVVGLGSLLAALGLPLFQRSGIELRPPTRSTAHPPASLAGAAARIPPSEDGLPQVRVEQYVNADGTSSWIVYATGTVEWSPAPGVEPSDLSSNLTEMAGQGSEMRSAIIAAMDAAGVHAGEQIVTVGHSQAGMVFAQIAADGDYNVVSELSFGSPTQQIAVPDGTTALAFEHDDDLVPVLGGVAVDPAESVGRTVVTRAAFDGRNVPDGEFFAAHQMDEYRDSARSADDSGHPAVVDFQETLDELTGGEDAVVTEWRADRVWPEEGTPQQILAPGSGGATGASASAGLAPSA